MCEYLKPVCMTIDFFQETKSRGAALLALILCQYVLADRHVFKNYSILAVFFSIILSTQHFKNIISRNKFVNVVSVMILPSQNI
jgi:hypothetical protein